MEKDVQTAVNAGVSTESDLLQVRVKANEARMMLTKATNGLTLSKMLLCKRIGLPLDSAIVLADETLDVIPEPGRPVEKSLEDIYESRPETRSLTLATKIFDKKAKVVRADLMPTVALMGAFTVSNPNVYNGFQNQWQGGNLSAGVMVKIPITHGGEALFKYKKAKAEARLYQNQLDDAKQMITLQVTQQRKLFDEALQKVEMARSNLDLAEDNLRSARVGLDAGVIATNTVLGAHTAWLSAHSEYIDAGIELQMTAASLRKAEGGYKN
jgi:outer membrane protein TolC